MHSLYGLGGKKSNMTCKGVIRLSAITAQLENIAHITHTYTHRDTHTYTHIHTYTHTDTHTHTNTQAVITPRAPTKD